MSLRARLLLLSVSTVALVVLVMASLLINSLIVGALDQTLERSEVAGRQLQAFLTRRIDDRMAGLPHPPTTFAAIKREWQAIVRDDKDLAAMLEQNMAQSRAIVEIEVADEAGVILASSNPARVGTSVAAKPDLHELVSSSPIKRLVSVLTTKSDYETRKDLVTQLQDSPVFRIQILVSPVLLRAAVTPDLVKVGWVSAFALVVAIAFAYATAHLALRPLQRIGRSLDHIITGAPVPQARDEQDREVAALESKLTLIGARVTGARQDAVNQRTTIGNLVRAVAHEIKNPLNAIAVRLEILRARLETDAPEAEGEIDLLTREVARMDRVVKTFLDLGRPVQLELTAVRVAATIDDVVDLVRPQAEIAGISLDWNSSGVNATIQADEGLLRQALLNVIKNALEAMPAGGMLTIRAAESAGTCEISVTDTGAGIDPEIRSRIFEPYFSAKQNGTGLGLAIAQRTVQLHGGEITVESQPRRGTTFRFVLPASAEKVGA